MLPETYIVSFNGASVAMIDFGIKTMCNTNACGYLSLCCAQDPSLLSADIDTIRWAADAMKMRLTDDVQDFDTAIDYPVLQEYCKTYGSVISIHQVAPQLYGWEVSDVPSAILNQYGQCTRVPEEARAIVYLGWTGNHYMLIVQEDKWRETQREKWRDEEIERETQREKWRENVQEDKRDDRWMYEWNVWANEYVTLEKAFGVMEKNLSRTTHMTNGW